MEHPPAVRKVADRRIVAFQYHVAVEGDFVQRSEEPPPRHQAAARYAAIAFAGVDAPEPVADDLALELINRVFEEDFFSLSIILEDNETQALIR